LNRLNAPECFQSHREGQSLAVLDRSRIAGDGDTPHPPATQSPASRNIVSSFARRKKHRQAKADKIRTGENTVSDQSRIGVLLLWDSTGDAFQHCNSVQTCCRVSETNNPDFYLYGVSQTNLCFMATVRSSSTARANCASRCIVFLLTPNFSASNSDVFKSPFWVLASLAPPWAFFVLSYTRPRSSDMSFRSGTPNSLATAARVRSVGLPLVVTLSTNGLGANIPDHLSLFGAFARSRLAISVLRVWTLNATAARVRSVGSILVVTLSSKIGLSTGCHSRLLTAFTALCRLAISVLRVWTLNATATSKGGIVL